MISDIQLEMFVNQLVMAIKSTFYNKHITMNLIDTIEIIKTEDGFNVRIPAVKYDLDEWRKNKIIRYTPELGSYAQDVDETGGFSGTHTNYVENAIQDAIQTFFTGNNIKIEVEGM